ncbi:MAG: alpha-L-rhamnosidase [Acidobacteriota bacterium]|nr:alpha-L-rhamnosidase [Acidobacteriota bacterium]
MHHGKRTLATALCCLGTLAIQALCQPANTPPAAAPLAGPLDPARALTGPLMLQSSRHTPLPEEYIWTAGEEQTRSVYARLKGAEQTEPRYFRKTFQLAAVPPQATLYIGGPRSLRVYLNGTLADQAESDSSSPLGIHVFATGVARLLRSGSNVLAIQAVRGHGVNGYANSALVHQQTSGEVLVAKIVPRGTGVDAPALLRTDATWKSSALSAPGWEQPAFNDSPWKAARSFGGIESSIELFQWNADAGMYNWPGYDGISGFLAHMPIRPAAVLAHFSGRGSISGLESLSTGAGGVLAVTLPPAGSGDTEAPSVTLDFGRELTGRLEIVSASDTPATLTMQMGESEAEALKQPFLGVNAITIPPHGTGHSSKSAFRYARIRFVAGAPDLRFSAIRVDHVYYPVTYSGSFESSDPMLNRIWETGAYTAHLCMQDGLWDASKRDRGRWMGDTDVSGRVVEDVFGDKPLMEDTLDRLLGARPEGAAPASDTIDQHVNGIPGYSAFWFTGAADYYRHTGAKAFLEREHRRMLELLALVDKEFDAPSIYANKSNVWLYVDWSPELNGDTAETRRATTLEFYRAYREAVWMLRELGDTANAAKYEARADAIGKAASQFLVDPATGTFGPRWQTNAAAVIGGAAAPAQYPAIWSSVLAQVGKGSTRGWIVSPYYNYYVIRAMAELGHRQEALAWIRQYWGGMIQQGATSFWEAYDPDWYKDDFHASLQADNRSGYFVSLAHGWSAGPTAWLMEQVLGIQPRGAGFSTVDIRPDLLDLAWARGAEPTPHGLLKVDARKEGSAIRVVVDLPEGVLATVSLPVSGAAARLRIDDAATEGTASEGGARRLVRLVHAGHYVLSAN